MKTKIVLSIEFSFYLFGLYLCLVWAKWIPRPNWIQEDIEPVYAIFGMIGLFGAFIWRINRLGNNNANNRVKNILKGNWIISKGNFHVGDIGKKATEDQSKKNIVEGNFIKSNKFHLGDKNE